MEAVSLLSDGQLPMILEPQRLEHLPDLKPDRITGQRREYRRVFLAQTPGLKQWGERMKQQTRARIPQRIR